MLDKIILKKEQLYESKKKYMKARGMETPGFIYIPNSGVYDAGLPIPRKTFTITTSQTISKIKKDIAYSKAFLSSKFATCYIPYISENGIIKETSCYDLPVTYETIDGSCLYSAVHKNNLLFRNINISPLDEDYKSSYVHECAHIYGSAHKSSEKTLNTEEFLSTLLEFIYGYYQNNTNALREKQSLLKIYYNDLLEFPRNQVYEALNSNDKKSKYIIDNLLDTTTYLYSTFLAFKIYEIFLSLSDKRIMIHMINRIIEGSMTINEFITYFIPNVEQVEKESIKKLIL